MGLSFSAVSVVVSLCISSIGLAQAPDSLSFQGFLTDTEGIPVADGNYNLLTKMYKGPTKRDDSEVGK